MTNDYKRNKPPIMDALLPFYPALRALAACMDDMQHKHKLAGAADPFNEWRNLPRAKQRLANAGLGHILQGPWKVNTEDGSHLHMTHALFGVLASLTIHLEDNAPACCGAADAEQRLQSTMVERAAIELGLHGEHQSSPIHGPAGADWREPLRCPFMNYAGRCALSDGHQGAHLPGENL